MNTGTRRYRWTASGEQPIWASRKKLVSMGQEWAEAAFRASPRIEPTPYGNLVHDEACARRWEILTGKLPSWFKPADARR